MAENDIASVYRGKSYVKGLSTILESLHTHRHTQLTQKVVGKTSKLTKRSVKDELFFCIVNFATFDKS